MKGAHPVQRRGAGNVLRAIVVTRRRPTPQIAGGRRRVSALRRLGSLESPSHQAASSCSPISCLLPFHGTATQRVAPTPVLPTPPPSRPQHTLPHKAVALATRRAGDRESRVVARCGASPSRPCATPPLPPPVPTRYYTPQHHSEPKEVPIPQKKQLHRPLSEGNPSSFTFPRKKLSGNHTGTNNQIPAADGCDAVALQCATMLRATATEHRRVHPHPPHTTPVAPPAHPPPQSRRASDPSRRRPAAVAGWAHAFRCWSNQARVSIHAACADSGW